MADKPGLPAVVNGLDGKPLIDQFGYKLQPIEKARLTEQIAAPSSFSARPPFEGHRAFGINPGMLGMYLRGADNGNTRDWFILAEEIEELFPHYSAVLSKRRRQVALLPMTVVASKKAKDGEKHADFVREWLETEVLEHAAFDILDAIGKGYSVNELIWDSRPDGVWPSEILWRNQRDFEVSWEDGETIWLRTAAGFDELAKHKFLLHAHKSKSGSPQRSGLTRLVAWMWMYSTFTLKDWALFVQGYGLPVRVGKFGPGASDDDKRTLWRALRGIAGDLAAMIPDSMLIEFVEAKGANDGAKLFSERANWLNYEVSKLVLGGTAGTDAVAGGHAVGQEHRGAEQDVEKFDARLLGGSVNQKIVPAMIAFSFGQQPGYPRIVIGIQEQVPVSDLIASVADLGPLGFRAKASEIRDRLQLTEPEDGDEVIGVPVAAQGGGVDASGNPIAAADVKIKANPHPEINPNSDTRALLTARRTTRSLRGFVALQTAKMQASADMIDALSQRVEEQAQGALASMTSQVRACAEQAEDFDDLVARLKTLKLDDTAFQTALMQGMVLANLAGQAELLDEIAAGQ
jgi:phage gp29-like protein